MKLEFLFIFFMFFISQTLYAQFNQPKAQGFHWYTQEEEEGVVDEKTLTNVIPQSIPTPYEELQATRKETLNKLAESILRPSLESTTDYMKAQKTMSKRHQTFVRNWEKALLLHPELDHRLHFPTDNNALAIKNDETKQLMEEVLQQSRERFGLIFVYQGKSHLSQRFSQILLSFIDTYQFSVIPVSVDGEVLSQLPNSKSISLDTLKTKMPIQKHFLPTLFLVNLKTKQLSPLSYGFIALSDLKQRFLDVATDFKRFSYEGLGG